MTKKIVYNRDQRIPSINLSQTLLPLFAFFIVCIILSTTGCRSDSQKAKLLSDAKAEAKHQLSMPSDSAHYEKALRLLHDAQEDDPSNAEVCYFLGCIYDKIGLGDGSQMRNVNRYYSEEASRNFNKAISINPKYQGEIIITGPYAKITSIWSSLAYSYLCQGKKDSAIWAFNKGKSEGGFLPVAIEYNRNVLNSCEPDAILFTQGDMDTFPIWYLQLIENYRTDVTVANLSLLNVSWYIEQLKTGYPYGKNNLPMNITDSDINSIQPIAYEPKIVDLPVRKEIIKYYREVKGIDIDPSIVKSGKVSFLFKETLQFGHTKALRVQDIAVCDIVQANEWKRPLYFASTCADDGKISLNDYLWFNGLTWKLEPIKTSSKNYGIDVKALKKNLMADGYTFRELTNPNVFYDDQAIQFIGNYRLSFRMLATYYKEIDKDSQKSIDVLEQMEKLMPHKIIPLGWQSAWNLIGLYNSLGKMDMVKELGEEIESECSLLIEKGGVDVNSYYNPYRALLDLYDMTKEYEKSLNILNKLLKMYPDDPGVKERIKKMKDLIEQSADNKHK